MARIHIAKEVFAPIDGVYYRTAAAEPIDCLPF